MKKYKNSKIFLAGHKGLVGSSVYKLLISKGFKKILVADKKLLDLRDQKKVSIFFKKNKPKFVIIAAAKVGGIKANMDYSAEFIYDNLQIQNNIIHQSYLSGVKNLVFLGSSCIYPKFSPQPIKEDYLLTSELEKTNEAYAIAKISGVKLCEFYNKQYNTNYKSLMPCNTFGPNDNYNLETCHFFPALVRKVYEAHRSKKKTIQLWGNGKTKREVIYVEDLAEAIIFFLFKKTKHTLINIGTQRELSINSYLKKIMNEFKLNSGLDIKYIKKNLVGTPRKVLSTKIANSYGWVASTPLKVAIHKTVKDFRKHYLKYSKL